MPKTSLQITGNSAGPGIASGTTSYVSLGGGLALETAETTVQVRIRATLTLKNLFVRVIANSLDGATTFRTRKNAANGNLSVSIGAGSTGVFEDTVNSDSLVDGDNSNYEMITGGTAGTISVSIASCTLEHATTETSVLILLDTLLGFGITRYGPLNGSSINQATESNVQYTFRFSGTLRRLNVRVSTNTLEKSTTLRTRKNAANGAQSVSIGAGATGEFEDGVNSDSVVSGDQMNYEIVTAGKAGQIRIAKVQMHLETTATDSFLAMGGAAGGSALGFGETVFATIAGTVAVATTESTSQTKIRGNTVTAQNFFVRITTNTLNGSTTFRTRKNGANGNLSVSVGAGATGLFEDTVNSDSYTIGDLVNYQEVTGGTAGSINHTIVAVQMLITAVVVVAIGRGDGFTWTVS